MGCFPETGIGDCKTSQGAEPDSEPGKGLQGSETTGSASCESRKADASEWSAEAATVPEEAGISSAACASASHTTEVAPVGVDAPTAVGAASDEAEGPATAGTSPEIGGDDTLGNGADAPTAVDAASEEIEGPATAGAFPKIGEGEDTIEILFGGSDRESLLWARFIRGGCCTGTLGGDCTVVCFLNDFESATTFAKVSPGRTTVDWALILASRYGKRSDIRMDCTSFSNRKTSHCFDEEG